MSLVGLKLTHIVVHQCLDTHLTLQVKNDLKNFLAWFAFEQVAYQLVSEIEPELV